MTAPNVRFDIMDSGYDRTRREDGSDRPGNWQVIFKCIVRGEESDYCRETQPGSISRERIVLWATSQCIIHKLPGAVIERW